MTWIIHLTNETKCSEHLYRVAEGVWNLLKNRNSSFWEIKSSFSSSLIINSPTANSFVSFVFSSSSSKSGALQCFKRNLRNTSSSSRNWESFISGWILVCCAAFLFWSLIPLILRSSVCFLFCFCTSCNI